MPTRRKGTGGNFPSDTVAHRLHGVLNVAHGPFALTVKSWPRKRGKQQTPAQTAARTDFLKMVDLVNQAPDYDKVGARLLAQGTGFTWRDVLSRAVTGKLWEFPGLEQAAIPFILDALSDQVGSVLYRSSAGWVGLLPTADGDVLQLSAGLPGWVDPATLPNGIQQLTGDVTAGPGSGSQVATLSHTGVAAGSYHHATLTVSLDGRITVAGSGAVATVAAVGIVKPDGSSITIDPDGTIHGAVSAITQLTGDIAAGPGSGSQAASLAATAVTAGSYHHASVTVDAKGRLTAAANGAVATGSAVGLVQPDNTTLTVDGSGILTAHAAAGIGLYPGLVTPPPTLGSGHWTAFGSPAGVDSSIGISMIHTSLAGLFGYHEPAPATPYTRSALISYMSVNGLVGMVCSDGTKLEAYVLNQLTPTLFRFNSPGSFNSTPFTATGLDVTSGQLWFRVDDNGTVVKYQMSVDGTVWWTITQVTKSGSFLGASGYTKVGFVSGVSATDFPTFFELLSWS